MGVYVHDIAYVLGDARPIREIRHLFEDESILEYLLATGLEYFRHSPVSPHVNAERSCAKTLQASTIAVDAIDALVYCSNSFGESGYAPAVAQLCNNLGMTKVLPIGVTLGDCSNLTLGLMVAQELLQRPRMRNILFVTTDCARDDKARLEISKVTVMSDGTASCILSRERASALELLGARQTSNHRLRLLTGDRDFLDFLKATAVEVKGVAGAVLGDLRLELGDIDLLITNNMNMSALRLFCKQIGIDSAKVYRENVGRMAHVYAADTFINLKDFLEASSDFSGHVMSVGNGISSWGASVIRVR